MSTVLFWIFIVGLAVALMVVAGLFVRAYLTGASPLAELFGEPRAKRLGVVEQSAVDGRRRLLLVRRDDVEHLILTGGPVDVVIETHIQRAASQAISYEDGQDGAALAPPDYGHPHHPHQ